MAYHLKTRIAVAVTLLMLVLLAVASWLTLAYFRHEFHTATVDYLSVSLETTRDDVDTHLRQASAILQAADRAIPRALLDDPAGLRSFFSRFETVRLTFDGGVMLYAPDGRLLAVGPGQEYDPQLNAAGRDFFAAALQTGRETISAPFRSAHCQDHPVVVLARPLLDRHGRVAAVLAGEIDLLGDNLLAKIVSRPIGKAGYLALFDRAGLVVLCPRRQLIFRPGEELLPKNVLAEVTADAAGEVHNVLVQEREVLVAYRALQHAPWIVAGFYPEDELHKPIRRAYYYTLLALLLLSLASVVLVRRLSSRLTAPLVALAGEVRRQLEPDAPFTPPPAGRFAELGELSESIRTLMAALGERRRELREQLNFLQNLIDNIPGPIFYKDASFRYLGCNRAFTAFIGLSHDELVGRTVFDIAPPELARVYQQADQQLWDSGGEQTYEASVKYADGSVHDVIFYKSVFRDADGRPAGLLGVFLDITERKRAEENLQKALAEAHAAREQVDNILRSAGDGMVVTNRRNRVTHINQVATEMLGVTAEEVVGKSYVRLFKNPELRRQAASFFAIRDISARQHDFLLRRDAAAEPDVMQARITPLRDRDGTLAGLVTLLRDVTRERKLDQLKSEFISTAAHEMRTPMSVITGYAELLLDLELVDSFDAEQKREFLREICRKVETLSRLVDDLFDISRIEAGLPLSLERAPCDLNAVVDEVVQRFASRSPRHDFAVTLAAGGPVVVDGSKMAQVFDNLISNAVKYSPQGGRIEIRSAEADGLLRFTVSDQGIGMTPAQLARVFDKFYRADSSDTAVGGLGLGMSIVKAIVEAHGGTISLESQPKAGTTVTFAIPTA